MKQHALSDEDLVRAALHSACFFLQTAPGAPDPLALPVQGATPGAVPVAQPDRHFTTWCARTRWGRSERGASTSQLSALHL